MSLASSPENLLRELHQAILRQDPACLLGGCDARVHPGESVSGSLRRQGCKGVVNCFHW
jgi:hypothetical protein